MPKIIYPICCGIDVHKSFVVACIAKTEGVVTSYKSKRFSTFSKGLRELSEWLNSNFCTDVCMESTGKYWIPVFNILESTCNVCLAHPKYVKAIKGKKTDKKDAQWIADLFKHDLVRASFMPPPEIRHLRDLCRYRTKLTYMQSSEKNRTQNCLTVSNIQLASVVSDTFGKSCQRIIEKILENPLDTGFDIAPLIHGSLKSKIPDLKLAIDGFITPEQAEKMKIIKQHFDALQSCKRNLESLISSIATPFSAQIDLLLTAPAINDKFTAIQIISEIGVDMSKFSTSKNLCSWAGLTPQNNESAGKKKSVRISKAGCYIKPLLVQCALAAINSKKHPEIRTRYQNIKMRRGHRKAIIAIARSILTAIWHMLSDNKPYNAEMYSHYNDLPTSREITAQQAISMIKRLGYKLKDSA